MVPTPKPRMIPNILVTGTPGTGKTLLCKTLSKEMCILKWINISELVLKKNFYTGYDDEYKCPFLNEDALLDYLEPIMQNGGVLIEYHSSEFFPERWFDMVFVMRTENDRLFDRLRDRRYEGKKLEDNLACEIMQTCLQEALDAYSHDIVVELKSDTREQLEDNVIQILGWLNWWVQCNDNVP